MSESVTTRDPVRLSHDPGPGTGRLVAALAGITSVVVLLQAVWAGIFLEHDGARDDASIWIDVHARGAEVAIALALITTVVAVVRLRSRKDIWIAAAALTVLLVLESYLGGLIRDDSKDTLTAVHVPLGMAIMALVVWIPLRTRVARTSA